ncbi:hypothetical protein JMN32_00035 [Fulvivirga sp. 29W222]|uniref:Uncharacterized protein n=1 Tax=Fulvivirga marina TaxID=2494733 RepID=A0A937FUS3_9BACT|nr:hypothetical protein [Fulvivirga marina]MBL6444675.1 hypothetical protein [Fulvivirga marina]
MTVIEPRIYGGYDDFYRDDVLYDHFLKKFRKKIKKRGLFKSIVRMGAPSLMLKKKLLKKKHSKPRTGDKAPPKTTVKLGIKSLSGASKAGQPPEQVRAMPPKNKEQQLSMLSPETDLDAPPELDDNSPVNNRQTQYILIGAAVGVIALVAIVRRKRKMQ